MNMLYILSITVLCLLLLWQKRKTVDLEERFYSLKEVQEVLITKATLKSREEERQRFARDWHDNMGNLLSTVRLLLDTVDTSNSHSLLQVRQLLEEAHTIAKEVYLGTQQSSLNTEQQFLAYCKDLQYQLGLGGIQFDYSIQEISFKKLSKDQKWHFSSILKELITNIIKHAQATRIQLDVATIARSVQLQVSDNGKGFAPGLSVPKTIKERLDLLNGQLFIETNTPSGTVMRIQF